MVIMVVLKAVLSCVALLVAMIATGKQIDMMIHKGEERMAGLVFIVMAPLILILAILLIKMPA